MRLFPFVFLLFIASIYVAGGYRLGSSRRRPMILHDNNFLSLTTPPDGNVRNTQFVFVGGKGGVGKTSSSSAIALKLSDENLRVLIVSVDPAHSLGSRTYLFICLVTHELTRSFSQSFR